MISGIDRGAVVAGASLALGVAVPVIVAVTVIDDMAGIDRDSNLVFVFYLAVMAGMVIGARLAARRGYEAPLTNAALAALAAYGLLLIVVVAARLINGHDIDPVALAFNGMVAASAGIVGGMLAVGRRPPAGTSSLSPLASDGPPPQAESSSSTQPPERPAW